MSVLIKNMNMPRHCGECSLLNSDEGYDCYWCGYEDGLLYTWNSDDIPIERPHKCPLVEVPTPHGRLIDVDMIPMDKQLEACGNGKYKSILVAYENNIDATPTVIESEE